MKNLVLNVMNTNMEVCKRLYTVINNVVKKLV